VLIAHFILWYGFLRIFIDFFREYRSSLYGLPPGQEFNIAMTLIGIGLLIWCYRRKTEPGESTDLPIEMQAAEVEPTAGSCSAANSANHYSQRLDPGCTGTIRRTPPRIDSFSHIS
jgi:hypothetical protein